MNSKVFLFLFIALATFLTIFALPPIKLPESYHDFAQSSQLTNILTNLPLFLVGFWGLWVALKHVKIWWVRLLWSTVFLGSMLTSIGSWIYHQSPNDLYLLLDRIPLTITITAFFSIILAEHLGRKVHIFISPLIIAIGLLSLFIWWRYNDLRLYAYVQFFPMLGTLLLIWLFPKPSTKPIYLIWAVGSYVLAKITEYYDLPIYLASQKTFSGHTLKHLLAALALVFIVIYVRSQKYANQSARNRS